MTKGGDGWSGKKWTEESIENARLSAIKRWETDDENRHKQSELIKSLHPRIHETRKTQEYRDAVGERNRTRTVTHTKKYIENHKKIFEGEGNPFYGKSHSKESIEKMRYSLSKSYPKYLEVRHLIHQRHLDKVVRWKIAEEFGIPLSSMNRYYWTDLQNNVFKMEEAA